MRCSRCGGFVIPDHPLAFGADPDQAAGTDYACYTRRCVNCGGIEDPVILKNRAAQRVALAA